MVLSDMALLRPEYQVDQYEDYGEREYIKVVEIKEVFYLFGKGEFPGRRPGRIKLELLKLKITARRREIFSVNLLLTQCISV